MKKTHYLVSLVMTFGLLMAPVSPAFAQMLDEHLQAARDYAQAKQWDYASYEWRNVLNSDPRHVEAHVGLATSLTNSGFPEEAIRHLEEVSPRLKHVGIELALAHTYTRTKKTEPAASRYQAILRQDPLHLDAFQGLKKLLSQIPAKERKALDRQLRDHALAARKKANDAFDKKQYSQAARHFGIVASYSQAPGPVNDYAISLLLSGEIKQAARQFHMVRKTTDNWRILSNSALSDLSLGKTFEARRTLEKAISLCGDDRQKALLYNNLGYAYEAAHHGMQALFAYEKAVALDPTLVKARLNRAYMYQKERRYDQAIAAYRELTRQQPGNAEVWNHLGFVYELTHDKKQAIAAYRKAIALDPKLEDAYLNLGTLYKKLDKLEKANETLGAMMAIKFNQIENRTADQQQVRAKNAGLANYTGLFLWEPVKQTKTASR